MRILPILFFLIAFGSSQPTTPVHPLQIDVRTGLFQNDLLKVTVQIENKSEFNIEYLEGFLIVIGQDGTIKREIRLHVIQPSDKMLLSKNSISASETMDYKEYEYSKFLFHISKIRFQGNYRLFTYHPAVGLIRID